MNVIFSRCAGLGHRFGQYPQVPVTPFFCRQSHKNQKRRQSPTLLILPVTFSPPRMEVFYKKTHEISGLTVLFRQTEQCT
jgi:hypothetical protein